MNENAQARLTPQAAIQTLQKLERYEESLTLKAAGLTLMIFGVAVPGIGFTYDMADDWVVANQMEWLFALFWVPWILGAVLITNGLWKSHALSLKLNYNKAEGWMYAVGFTLGFFLLWGLVHLASQTSPFSFLSSVQHLIANGLLTISIGIVGRACKWRPVAPIVLAGIFLIAVGIGLGLLGASGVPLSLLAAASIWASYFSAGLYLFHRG